jgi:hypothetical protein
MAVRLTPSGFAAFLMVELGIAAPAEEGVPLVLVVDVVLDVDVELVAPEVLVLPVGLVELVELVVLVGLVALVVLIDAVLPSGTVSPPQPPSTATITSMGVRKSERPGLTTLVICI